MLSNPYHLVYVNIFILIATLISLVYYKLVLKKKINLFVLLILASLLPVWSIFRPGSYESGDFSIHVTQAISFYKSLTEGILIPRWAGDLNASYGFPAFMFIYPLPYYIISFFHFLGFSFILSTKLLLATSFIASGIGAYLWIKEELNERAGLIAGIFYLFAPYHLVDTHFRVDIGETLAFAILPFLLFYIKRSSIKANRVNLTIVSLLFSLLILSHPAISLASILFILVYLIYLVKINFLSKNNLISLIICFVLGALISSFYWLPTIYDLRFTQQAKIVYFENFSDFIFSPWRLGLLFQGPNGQLSFIIGYIQIILIAFAIYKLLFIKKISSFLRFLLLTFFIYFLAMQKISQPIWNILPFVHNFQFTYRLSLYISLITAALSASMLYKIKNKKIIILLCVLAVSSTMLNWGNRKLIPTINDAYFINNLPLSTAGTNGLSQAITIWLDVNNPWFSSIPKNHLQITQGDALIKNESRSQINHSYVVSVSKQTTFQENTLFFPGWNLYVNNRLYPIKISKINSKGTITFTLQKGLYYINLSFEETPVIKTSNLLSILSFFILVIFFLKVIPSDINYSFKN